MAQTTVNDYQMWQEAKTMKAHELSPGKSNLKDMLFQPFESNIMSCKTYEFITNNKIK